MTKRILFDLDNTLLDFNKSAEYAFGKSLAHFDIIQKNGYFDVYKQVNDLCWKSFENNEITAVELRRKRFEMFFDSIGEYRDPMEVNEYYLKILSGTKFLMDGALRVLKDLTGRPFKLIIITNGLKEVQRPRIRAAGLHRYFEKIVVSDEIGHAKPHPEFFEHALNHIPRPRIENIWVVGDSLHSDIKGGNDFGLKTCWFNPHKTENNSGIHPDFEIQKLSELHNILR